MAERVQQCGDGVMQIHWMITMADASPTPEIFAPFSAGKTPAAVAAARGPRGPDVLYWTAFVLFLMPYGMPCGL